MKKLLVIFITLLLCYSCFGSPDLYLVQNTYGQVYKVGFFGGLGKCSTGTITNKSVSVKLQSTMPIKALGSQPIHKDFSEKSKVREEIERTPITNRTTIVKARKQKVKMNIYKGGISDTGN